MTTEDPQTFEESLENKGSDKDKQTKKIHRPRCYEKQPSKDEKHSRKLKI